MFFNETPDKKRILSNYPYQVLQDFFHQQHSIPTCNYYKIRWYLISFDIIFVCFCYFFPEIYLNTAQARRQRQHTHTQNPPTSRRQRSPSSRSWLANIPWLVRLVGLCGVLGPILGESNMTFIYPNNISYNGPFEGNIDMSILHLWSL